MEKLDLTQILKDCSKGTKLYSPLFGEVTFVGINCAKYYPVIVQRINGDEETFTDDGRYNYDCIDAECLLFPSRDNRDWSTFKVGRSKPKFEPFQKVLARNHDGQKWNISLYSYLRKGWANPHVCIEDCYNQCIPYEGNESLLGTTDDPKNGGIKGNFGTNGGEVVLPYTKLQNKMKGE